MSKVLWAQDCGFVEAAIRSCRNCANYVRVEDNRYDSLPSSNVRRGFCILGEGEANFGLYISSSGCNSCKGFLFNQKNALITEEEHGISQLFNEFEKTEGKKIEKALEKAQRELRKEKMFWFFTWIEARAETNKQFRIANLDMLCAFEKKFDLSWKDYVQFIDIVANFAKQYLQNHQTRLLETKPK